MAETERPSPAELWQQAGGNAEEYRRLMREHGHLVPGTPELLPCGWPGGGNLAARLTPFLGEDAKARLEKDGGRYLPPFLLWLDGPEVMVGHVVRGQVASSGAADPDRARELAVALLEYARLAEAEAQALDREARDA